MSEVARIEGVKLIKQMIVNELPKFRATHGGVGIVVVGDFNATENSAPIQSLAAPLSDSDGNLPPSFSLPSLTLSAGKLTLQLKNAKFSTENPHHGPTGTFTGFNFEVKPPILIDCI